MVSLVRGMLLLMDLSELIVDSADSYIDTALHVAGREENKSNHDNDSDDSYDNKNNFHGNSSFRALILNRISQRASVLYNNSETIKEWSSMLKNIHRNSLL